MLIPAHIFTLLYIFALLDHINYKWKYSNYFYSTPDILQSEWEQGHQENSEALGQKRKRRPPASEASRKFLWSRPLLWKIIAGLPYEDPDTLKNLVL